MLRKSLLIHPDDSVVCLLEDARKNDTVRTPSGEVITLREDVAFAHKVSIRDLKAGDPVLHLTKERRRLIWLPAPFSEQAQIL